MILNYKHFIIMNDTTKVMLDLNLNTNYSLLSSLCVVLTLPNLNLLSHVCLTCFSHTSLTLYPTFLTLVLFHDFCLSPHQLDSAVSKNLTLLYQTYRVIRGN